MKMLYKSLQHPLYYLKNPLKGPYYMLTIIPEVFPIVCNCLISVYYRSYVIEILPEIGASVRPSRPFLLTSGFPLLCLAVWFVSTIGIVNQCVCPSRPVRSVPSLFWDILVPPMMFDYYLMSTINYHQLSTPIYSLLSSTGIFREHSLCKFSVFCQFWYVPVMLKMKRGV